MTSDDTDHRPVARGVEWFKHCHKTSSVCQCLNAAGNFAVSM